MKNTIAVVFCVLEFLCSITQAQQVEWIRRTDQDGIEFSRGVSADGLGSVYISGLTYHPLDPDVSLEAAFVRKYDAAGNLLWNREPNTSAIDEGFGISADGLGSVYMTGYTSDDLSLPTAGGDDAFITKYDEDGTLQWTQKFGSTADDIGYGVSADGLGNVYMSGATKGTLQQR